MLWLQITENLSPAYTIKKKSRITGSPEAESSGLVWQIKEAIKDSHLDFHLSSPHTLVLCCWACCTYGCKVAAPFPISSCIFRQKEGGGKKANTFPEILSRFLLYFTRQNCVTSPPWAAREAIKLSTSSNSFLIFRVKEDKKERVGAGGWWAGWPKRQCLPWSLLSILVVVVGSLYSSLIYNLLLTLFDFSWP